MRRFLCALMTLSIVAPAVHARETPKMHVYSETELDALSDCGFRYASSVAAVQSELRRNNVEIAKIAEKYDPTTLQVSLTVNPRPISSVACAMSYRLQMYHMQDIYHVLKQRSEFVIVESCSLGGLAYFPATDMQTRINEAFRDMTNECIAEYLKQ